MMRPCRRTPRYHLGPILLSLTSSNPAAANHCTRQSGQATHPALIGKVSAVESGVGLFAGMMFSPIRMTCAIQCLTRDPVKMSSYITAT